jgi:hypothetical protein
MIGRAGQSADEATSVRFATGVDATVVDAEVIAEVGQKICREAFVLDIGGGAGDAFPG